MSPRAPSIIIVAAAVALGALLLAGCSHADPKLTTRALEAGALVVDVRTPREFSEGHFPGAVNIPVGDLEQRRDELGAKDREIVVYCHSGFRSRRARSILGEAGFTRVTDGGGLGDIMPLAPRDKPAAN